MSDGFDMALDSQVAEVGSAFEGRVWRPPTPEADGVRGVRLRLRMYVDGHGDSDEWSSGEAHINLRPDGSVDTRFRLPVPAQGPISYEGQLLTVTWHIEARLDVKLRPDDFAEYPVLVIPKGGLGRYNEPHPRRRR